MRVFKRSLTGLAFALAVIVLVTAGASSKTTNSTSTNGEVIDIYSSLPLAAPLSEDSVPLLNGEKLALAQSGDRAGSFTVKFISLNDSGTANWTDAQCAADGRRASADRRTIAYIGEFNSGCSEVSLPILNQRDIPMISPANTSVGLTTDEPGSTPGEPQKYYPTGVRTYLRIVPRDTVEAAADALAMQQAGCTGVALANDESPYGAGLTTDIDSIKTSYGLDVVSDIGVNPAAPNYRSYAATIKGLGADCFFYGGLPSTGGVQITKDVHSAIPEAELFGPDGMCVSGWTDPGRGGVPTSLDPRMECTIDTLKLTDYPGGQRFLNAYRAKYGHRNPGPYAIYGYEAMKLVLSTISRLGPKGDRRAALRRALFATTDRHSVLGTYSFDKNGDTTLTYYGLYKVASGNLKFDQVLRPTHIF
jgi:branched-chain amino acid transport system substrate-binding protein